MLENIIQKLGEVYHNLTLIKWCEIEGNMTKEMADLIGNEKTEILMLIKELETFKNEYIKENKALKSELEFLTQEYLRTKQALDLLQAPKKKLCFTPDLNFITSPDWVQLFQRWLNYKNCKNQKYKNQDSIELCYKKLQKFSNCDIKVATEILEDAMGNGYAGFFKPRPVYSAVNNYHENKDNTQKIVNKIKHKLVKAND